MNIREYREDILSGYTDKKEGLLMYKHQKYFDITHFIKEAVDIGKSDKPISKNEYRLKIDSLFQRMPSEFQEQYKYDYEEFIIAHSRAHGDAIRHSLPAVVKFLLGLLKKHNKRLNTRMDILKDPSDSGESADDDKKQPQLCAKDINIVQHGSATVIRVKDTYRNEAYSDTGMGGFYKKGKRDIYLPENADEDTLNHEYMHFLDVKLIPERPKNATEWIDYHIKDEFLAWMTNSTDPFKAAYGLITYYLPKYLKHFGLTVGKPVTINLFGGENNNEEPFTITPEVSPELKNLIIKKASLISLLYQTYEDLEKICVPTYYSKDQLLYLLAITPMSLRRKLLHTYEDIQALNSTKGELYEDLTTKK